jgi:hypothetical protein
MVKWLYRFGYATSVGEAERSGLTKALSEGGERVEDFKPVNIAPLGAKKYPKRLDNWDEFSSFVASAAIDLPEVARDEPASKRPAALQGKATPKLDELAKREPDAPERYVKDHAEKYQGALDLAAYVEGRAARKLGRKSELPAIQAYASETGLAATRNTRTVEVLSEQGDRVLRERIPDVLLEGKAVAEVKNEKTVSLDEQMRDDVRIARGRNVRLRGASAPLEPTRRFDLIVRAPSDRHPEGTHVSRNLEEAVAENGGKVYDLVE